MVHRMWKYNSHGLGRGFDSAWRDWAGYRAERPGRDSVAGQKPALPKTCKFPAGCLRGAAAFGAEGGYARASGLLQCIVMIELVPALDSRREANDGLSPVFQSRESNVYFDFRVASATLELFSRRHAPSAVPALYFSIFFKIRSA
jgi:hypothetical protein